MKIVIGLAVALAATTATGATAESIDAARGAKILADARAACGGVAWDRIAGWHERGRISIPGAPEGAYEGWFAITSLAMAMKTEPGGAAVTYVGTDGATAWRVMPGGAVESGAPTGPSQLHPRDAYVSNFGYFLPTRYPAAVVALDPKTVGATVYDVVNVRPVGAEDFNLWIDRVSHRVARIVVGNQVAELRNYRTVSGVCAPTLTVQTDGNPAHTTTIYTDSVDTAALPGSVFAPPPR